MWTTKINAQKILDILSSSPSLFSKPAMKRKADDENSQFQEKMIFDLVNFWAHKDRNHSHSAEPLMFLAIINKDWGDWIRRSFLNTWIPFLEDLIWRRHQLSFDTRGLDFFSVPAWEETSNHIAFHLSLECVGSTASG